MASAEQPPPPPPPPRARAPTATPPPISRPVFPEVVIALAVTVSVKTSSALSGNSFLIVGIVCSKPAKRFSVSLASSTGRAILLVLKRFISFCKDL